MMNAHSLIAGRLRHRHSNAQRGFSLFMTLIALAILLVATAAIMRSSGLNLFASGNLAFKQDLVARADLVNVRIYALLRAGGALSSNASLTASNTSENYSAVVLPSNTQGIPLALVNDSSFSSVGESSNDIVDADSNTTMRYVIERLCDQLGDPQLSHCVYDPASSKLVGIGGSTANGAGVGSGPTSEDSGGAGGGAPVYRVTVRVQGPRGSETYLQSSFHKPI